LEPGFILSEDGRGAIGFEETRSANAGEKETLTFERETSPEKAKTHLKERDGIV
jgi:hypothetical protein